MADNVYNSNDIPPMFSRTAMVYGCEAIKKLQSCRVAVFGLGGVGGYIAESLVRAGIGTIDIVDKEVVTVH